MGYPYGTQNGPAFALSAPGLPRRAASSIVNPDTTTFPARYMVVRSDQPIRVPDWATYARMGASGAGGNGFGISGGTNAGSGGGCGFAGSNAVKATPGALINVRFDGTATVVEGLGYSLRGGNGGNGSSGVGGAAGIGTGGDVNYTGGSGGGGGAGVAPGGGAAGRGGNGSGGSNGIGGQGAPGIGYLTGSSGGGGATPGAIGTTPAATFGIALIPVGVATSGAVGGDGGGGGGGSSTAGTNPAGGAGFALIEFW
jgi:hypothetical protein